MGIINPIIIAKFFHIIHKALFIFLSATSEVKKRLLKLILNYFIIVEINRHKMLYLHCLI